MITETLSQEAFFPIRWVLHGVSRQEFAAHLRLLRRFPGGRELAMNCVYHALWVGVYPLKEKL